MHAAPFVRYAVGRSRVAAAALAIAWGAAAASATAWALLHLEFDAARVACLAAGASLAAAGAAGMWAWRRQRPALLAWTGAAWQLDGQVIAPPSVRVDGNDWALVAIGRLPRRRWLWLDGATAHADWSVLRSALFARPAPAAPAVTDGAAA